jgi:hypothetical protein
MVPPRSAKFFSDLQIPLRISIESVDRRGKNYLKFSLFQKVSLPFNPKPLVSKALNKSSGSAAFSSLPKRSQRVRPRSPSKKKGVRYDTRGETRFPSNLALPVVLEKNRGTPSGGRRE